MDIVHIECRIRLSNMSSHSPPKPHVRRERARFEELERVSRGELRDRPNHRKSASASGSTSTSSSSPGARGSPTQQRPRTSTSSPSTETTALTTPTYPNYYDYSENTEIISPAKQRQQQQPVLQTPQRNTANMAMQVPIQPYSQQQAQQPHSPSRHSSNSASASASATPRQNHGPTNLTTAQLQQAVARGDSLHNQKLNGSSNATNTNGHRASSAGNRPPSFSSSTGGPRSPADDIFPPNKVDLDAARFRHAQQAQSRRERGSTTSDRDRPPPPAKDPRDSRRPSQQTNGRPASMNMGLPHQHSGGRPLSPESPPTGLGNNIVRLATPSIPNSVLQPLDAKVVEYGSLMTEAQGEMARLDEEMRLLQDRQREAEQRFLEAKAKHDDYRRQYSDVERALRGEFASVNGHGRDRRDRELDEDVNGGGVAPAPSMPNLQHYGVDSRQGSGMALNNNQGHPGMRSQRTVSIQSDMDGDMSRPGSKRGRFSRLFGV